jgi:hypothetical protein
LCTNNEIGFDSLNNRYFNNTTLIGQSSYCGNCKPSDNINFKPIELIDNYENISVLILNRGVDPYTPKVPIKYGLGRLFGFNNLNQIQIEGYYHMNIPIQGKFLNISHSSGDYPLTTVNGITAGSNVGVDSYTNTVSNTNQKLYFNSFSYKPQTVELWGTFTGTSLGLPYTYTAVTSSKYSAFTSNLVSYYSHMDNTSIGWKADCGGVGVNNVSVINNSVAYSNFNYGLKIASNNEFSWRIVTFPATCYGDSANVNISLINYTYSSNTQYNQGYFPNEIVEGGPVLYTYLYIN